MPLTKGAEAILKLWPWLVPEGCEPTRDATVNPDTVSRVEACACCGRRHFVPSRQYASHRGMPTVPRRRLWFVETARKRDRDRGTWDERKRMKDIFECCYRKATGRKLPRPRS